MNLLKETVDAIKGYSKTVYSVRWVGSRDGKYAMNWKDFEKIADIDYDTGYGGQEIARDLVVVFVDDSYLYRHEYDGAEHWNLASTPRRQPDAESFARVKGEYSWVTLDELNNLDKEDKK